MAVRGGASIKITGNVTEALAALDRLGIRAAEVGAETESKLGGAAEKTGGLFSKLGNVAGSFGLPFSESLSKMGEKFNDVEGKGASFRAKLAEVGKAATLGAAAGLGAVAFESVKLGENYQQATAKIAASSGVSIAAAKNVSDQFLKTGFDSTFSAQEMATAYGQVAGQLKATEGHALSASDAMSVMKAATDLAEASGSSLGDSTSALAGVMQAYGLKTKDAAKASDQLYNVATLTNQPILGLAQVLDRLKGRLGDLAPSLQDVSTLMAFPAVAAQGSRGAMVVNTALTTLLGGSKNVSKELKSLGVNIFDANGKFIGLRGVIEQLQPKLGKLSQSQQIAAEKTLFGASAGQLMNKVIQGGTPGYDRAAAAVGRMGSAHEAAEKQANTLHGQEEKLKSGLEDLGVRLGQALIPKLVDLGNIVGKLVTWFEKHKVAAVALAAIVGGALVTAFGAWAIELATTTVAIGSMEIAIAPIALAVVALGIAAYELATHWSEMWGAIKSVIKAAWNDGIKPVFEWIKTIAIEPIKLEIKGLELIWHATWDAIKSVLNAAWNDVIKPVFGFIKTVAIEPIKLEIQGLETIWSTTWDAIKSALNFAWNNVIKPVFGFIQTVAINPIKSAISTLGGVWGKVWGGVQTAVSDVWSIIKPILDALLSALNAIKNAWNDLTGALNIGNSKSFQNILNGKLPTGQAVPRGLDNGNALAGIKKYALGGMVNDGWFSVGERGPELGYKYGNSVQIFPSGSSPAAAPAAAGHGGQQIVVNMYGATPDANQMASEIGWQLRPYLSSAS